MFPRSGLRHGITPKQPIDYGRLEALRMEQCKARSNELKKFSKGRGAAAAPQRVSQELQGNHSPFSVLFAHTMAGGVPRT